jgi:hypothetical protein
VSTRLLLWSPTVAYLDDLSRRRVDTRAPIFNRFAYGDYQPLATVAGDRLVYNTDGVAETAPDLQGPSRRLSDSDGFAPAATDQAVWLTSSSQGRRTARLVSLDTRAALRRVTLPVGTVLFAGTHSGLLVEQYTRPGQPLGLWRPGHAVRRIPGTLRDGFAVTADTISYGRKCRTLNPNGRYEPDVCQQLVVRRLRSARLRAYRAPAGTVGWVPDEFNLVNNVNPSGHAMAAVAASSPHHPGRGALFVVSLRQRRAPLPVPGDTSTLARVAWSIRGDWLFYEGGNGRLHAYQPATGHTAVADTPCCKYTVMAALPSR